MGDRRTDVLTDTGERTQVDLDRTRKRFARRQWARRFLAWRPLLVVVLVLALVGGLVWLFLFSSVLAVKRVQVEGTGLLSQAEVRSAAAVPLGEPLARVDIDAIRDRVGALAPVATVDVTRHWPDQVLISITERTAVAVVEVGNSLKGIDAGGVYFREYAHRPRTLPLITGADDVDREVLHEAAKIVGLLPTDVAARVAHIQVETIDQISLILRDGRVVVWGSAERSDDKARVLEALLHQRAQTYDVSVPGQPTTRG
jgi:cell division protein FtsQ